MSSYTKTHAILCYSSNGVPIGPLATYWNNNLYKKYTDFDIYWYGGESKSPQITVNGTQIIIELVYNTSLLRRSYYDIYSGLYKYGVSGVNTQDKTTFTLEHDQCLVYNTVSKTLSVASPGNNIGDNNVILVYNSSGSVCGPWHRYYVETKINNIKDAMPNIVPDYYKEHIQTKADAINEFLKEAGNDSDAFIFITDIHWGSNRKASPSLIKYICDHTGINKVIMGGDYINRETTYIKALDAISTIFSTYSFNNVVTLPACGNHEYNNPGASKEEDYVNNQLSNSDLIYLFTKRNENSITYSNDYLSYYYDNPNQKIRYIFGSTKYNAVIEDAAIYWTFDKIYELQDNWSVVYINHRIADYNENTNTASANNNIVNFLTAVKNKSSITINNKSYDFTNKNIDVIMCLCGHWHYDFEYTFPNSNITCISTTTDSMQEWSVSSLTRTNNTVSQQAFDVCIINRKTRKVNLVRVGAGLDREISY